MAERSRTGRVATRMGVVALGAGIILSTASATVLARARPAQVVDGPVAASATLLDSVGSNASVSGDGRFVAFESVATSGDLADRRTVMLHDRAEATTVELSPLPTAQRPGDTIAPVLSGDGCSVTVLSEVAFDVFRDDDNGARWDVYRAALPHCGGTVGEWEVVSTRDGPTAVARNDVVPDRPSVSDSGTLIAFTHPADHLAEAEGLTAITVVDVAIPADDPARTQLAPGLPVSAPNTVFVHGGMDQPALSGDGRHLAFRSDATSDEAVPQWAPGPVEGAEATGQVYVWDRQQADPFVAVTLVSAMPDGSSAPAGAELPAIARDGQVVAFTSVEQGLVPGAYPQCDGECPSQVFHLDRDPGDDGPPADGEPSDDVLTLISRNPDAPSTEAGTSPSTAPALNADGQQVAFVSSAANLSVVPTTGGGEPGDGAVFVADVTRGLIERVSEGVLAGRAGAGLYARPTISDGARTVVLDGLVPTEARSDPAAPGRRVAIVSRPPALSLADADFGTTMVGLASDEWYVAVVNDGPSTFLPATVTVDDPHFVIDQEGSTCALGTEVPPGRDCTVRVTFTPTADGDFGARLTVAEDGFDAVSITAEVTGAGGVPALRADPAGTDIGRTLVGTPAREFHFDITNVSELPTEIAAVVPGGEHVEDFAVTTDNCVGRPLNPGVACNVGVTFTPRDAGRRTATLTVQTIHGQSTSVVVAGDGAYEPKIAFSEPEVAAGRDLIAWGTGYPADADVTVRIGADTDPVTIRTDDRGQFIAPVPVPLDTAGGERTVVIESSAGVAASAPIEVVENQQPLVGMPGFGLGPRRT